MINRNKEKALQWSLLQCNSFKITIWWLQTTEKSFIDISGWNEFSCKEALSNSFYLTSLPVFWTLSGKTNGIQTNTGHNNTEHALTTNLACIFVEHFLLSEEMKDKCIAINQNYQILLKLSLDEKSLTKPWHKSEKTLVEWFCPVLARVRLVDSLVIRDFNTEEYKILLHIF